MQEIAWLTPEELSARWRGHISEKTLANWRCQKRGPQHGKLGGKVVYRLDLVVAYENDSIVQQPPETIPAEGQPRKRGRPSKADIELRAARAKQIERERALAELDEQISSLQRRKAELDEPPEIERPTGRSAAPIRAAQDPPPKPLSDKPKRRC